jgi:hypothetical protein
MPLLQASRQPQSMPAHCRPELHEAAPPSDAGQHACPDLPHAHMPEAHVTLLLHDVPLQQACPGSPHAHLPADVHVKFGLQMLPQHGSPAFTPQLMHVPFTHCFPTPQAGLHVAIMLASPPELVSPPASPPIVIMPSIPPLVPSLPPPSGCPVVDASGGSVTPAST